MPARRMAPRISEPRSKLVPTHTTIWASAGTPIGMPAKRIIGVQSGPMAALKERLIGIEAEQQPARRPVHLEMDHAMLTSGEDIAHVAVERARAKNRTRCRRII